MSGSRKHCPETCPWRMDSGKSPVIRSVRELRIAESVPAIGTTSACLRNCRELGAVRPGRPADCCEVEDAGPGSADGAPKGPLSTTAQARPAKVLA